MKAYETQGNLILTSFHLTTRGKGCVATNAIFRHSPNKPGLLVCIMLKELKVEPSTVPIKMRWKNAGPTFPSQPIDDTCCLVLAVYRFLLFGYLGAVLSRYWR